MGLLKIFGWRSKRLSEGSVKNPVTSDNSFALKHIYINNSKIAAKFKENCLKQDKVSFIHKNVVNFFVADKLDIYSYDSSLDFTLKYCLFCAIKLVKTAYPDKYSCSGYDIGFNSRSHFSIVNLGFSKSFIIFGADNSSTMYAENRKITNTRIRQY